jgi:signal transduction histidine kinase
MRQLRLSLRVRLALASALGVLVVTTIAGLVELNLLTSSLLNRVDRQLDSVVDAIVSLPGAGPPEEVPVLILRELADRQTLLISIVDARGRSYYQGAGAAQLRTTPKVRRLAAEGGADVVYTTNFGDSRVRVLARSIGEGRVLLVGRTVEDVTAAQRSLGFFLVAQGVLSVAVAFGLGYLVTAQVMRPVRRMAATAQRISDTGDLAQRVEEGGADRDLANLTATFNQMLDRIEAAYSRLAASLEAERRFVADASHELRTPLTTIRGNVDYLERVGVDAAAVADLRESSERLAGLVTGLTQLARDDAGVVDEVTAVDFDQLVCDVAAEPEYSDVDIDVDVEPSLWVRGSEGALARVVRNLLGNAAKYGAGSVTVRAAKDEDCVVLEVRDNGPGIRAEDVERVFDRFWRSAEAKSRSGSGLGLSIVKAAVTAHGGSVRAFPGPGGRVVVKLPACPPPDQT